MNRIALALLATAGLGATVARANGVTITGSIHIGGPVYTVPTPVHHAPPPPVRHVAPRGYWKEVTVNVWVPGRWIVKYDRYHRPYNYWERPHMECRTHRVWVDGYAADDRRHHNSGRWNG